MLSLRQVSPNAHIVLLVDDCTFQKENNFFLESIKELANECRIITIPSDLPAVAKSRHIKTSMRLYIDETFLYVDSDTIWLNPIDERDFTFDIMGVLDGHCLFSESNNKKSFEHLFDKIKCNPQTDYYINSGVLFSRDSDYSRQIFSEWHEKWLQTSKNGIYVDQPSLNYILSKRNLSEDILLPGEYNCQITNSWDYFFKAKIIHYFSSNSNKNNRFDCPYLLQQQSFWEHLRNKANSFKTEEIIDNPLALFEKGFTVKTAAARDFEESRIYGFAKDLYTRKISGQKSKFDFIEKILSYISKE